MLKAIHAQEDKAAALAKGRDVVEKLRAMKLAKAADLVAESLDETLSYMRFPEEHWRRIRTNNPLERIMKEIRRRTRVVGAFLDGQSCLNLAAARLRYIAGTAWSAKRYMNMRPLYQPQVVQTEAELEAIYGKPGETSTVKVVDRVTPEYRPFIEKSPLVLLATVGSTAPFVGLLGTVWGIMRSFTAIADQQNTSLAVVAPGIAEALAATAVGLFAAIPAVIAYNRYSAAVNLFEARLQRFADRFHASLSRELDGR